jgi:hypothetical protein
MPCNFFRGVTVPDLIHTKPQTCPNAVLCEHQTSCRRPSGEWQRNSSRPAIQTHPGGVFRAAQGSRSEKYMTSGDIEKLRPGHRLIVRSIISQMTVMAGIPKVTLSRMLEQPHVIKFHAKRASSQRTLGRLLNLSQEAVMKKSYVFLGSRSSSKERRSFQ